MPMHVWDKSKSTCVDYLFSPWLFGSQPPSVLLGTFSTIMNFNIIGLLRRLHKLQILFEIESQSSGTGIYTQTSLPKEMIEKPTLCMLEDMGMKDLLVESKTGIQFHLVM